MIASDLKAIPQPSMRVTRLRVTNFRSIADETIIQFRSPHAVLAGANNAGKSNLLTALEWALRHSFRLRPHVDDYFDPTNAIEIEATIADVDEDDKRGLFALCTNNQQRGALASSDDPEISIKLVITPIEPTTHAGDEDDGDPAQISLDISLWGFPVRKRVRDTRAGIAHLLVVSPHRRVGDDLSASRWTPYGQLMKDVLEESPRFEAVQGLLDNANQEIAAAFAAQTEKLLADARVVGYVDDISFQLTREGNPVELLRNLEVLVTDSGRRISLDRIGTGTQSAVIIGMLELVLRAKSAQARIFVVEEPDAFIHPHGIRRLAAFVKRIASEASTQVVLSTHSPALLTTLVPGEIVRVEKRDDCTQVFQASGAISDQSFARYINQETAEMFFARRVVLVEGATERFLLPPLSELVKRESDTVDFSRSCTSVIDMNGKSSVVAYLRLLREFSIDARAILDSDFLGGQDCDRLVKYLRSLGAVIDDANLEALRQDLLKNGIAVLSQGEIEDYVPVSDVASASGRSEDDVTKALASHSKSSDAFKKLFGTGKPQYGQELASYYVAKQEVPSELRRLIDWAGA